MNQSEIEHLLMGVVREIQILSGRKDVDVTPDTCPILDVPGFDSLNGVEATIDVLARLKLTLEANNVFADDSGALTIREAAAKLFQHVESKS